jgi:hypothetical protein
VTVTGSVGHLAQDPCAAGPATTGYPGAIVMVTHDAGAVEVLRPGRVLLLPEGEEDLWSAGHAALIAPERDPGRGRRRDDHGNLSR